MRLVSLLVFWFVNLAPRINMVPIPSTYGALMLGALFAAGLSGIVTVQAFLYIKLYPLDMLRTKIMVTCIWILDSCHTGFVCASVWYYLIVHFGDASRLDDIPSSVALTIVFTAILTFVVHCFFIHRIFKLSRHNIWITAPIAVFAFLRLCSACVTTGEMLHLRTFSSFVREIRWVFTLGLALSSLVDVLITIFLCYSLESNRSHSSSMDQVINLLILYAFENGALTCAATIISMICWLVMPSNRIFMGLHFVISKLYANSLLATLNTRRKLQEDRARVTASGDHPQAVLFTDLSGRFRSPYSGAGEKTKRNTQLEINVEKTVEVNGQAVTFTESNIH